MPNIIEVEARINDTELKRQEADWQLRLRRMNLDIQRTRLELKRTELRTITVISTVVSIGNALASMLPGPLRILAQGVVNMVQSTVAAIQATALALTTAGAANPLSLIQAAVAWIAVGMAAYSFAVALDSQAKLDSDLQRFQSGMTQMTNALQNITYSLGGY